MLKVELEEDKKAFAFNKDFLACLSDDPPAKEFFETLPGSHQALFQQVDRQREDRTHAGKAHKHGC